MGSVSVFTLRSSSLILILAVTTWIPCEIHGTFISAEQFNKVPLRGTSLEVYGTGTRGRSSGACALKCLQSRKLNSASVSCQAFWFESDNGTCTFYKIVESVIAAYSNLLVYQFQVTDRFHQVFVGHEQFSILASSTATTFFEARAACKALGGYLLEFDSLLEYDAIDLVTAGHPLGKERVYVGANDLAKEGHWVTDKDNRPLDTSLWRWTPGRPDNYGGIEHCAILHIALKQIGDIPCSLPSRRPYLCEKTLK